jgi:hypothetical protein
MQKLSITEVADKFGISKEAVYNRIRRGTFKTIEEDGVKFIILDDEEKAKKMAHTAQKQTHQILTHKYLNLLSIY